MAQDSDDVVEIGFTKDGHWLVSNSGDGIVRASPLSPVFGNATRILLRGRPEMITIATDSSTRTAVAAVSSGRLNMLRPQGGPPQELQGLSAETFVGSVTVEDGRLVAAAGESDVPVHVFDLETGRAQSFAPRISADREAKIVVDNVGFLGPEHALATAWTAAPKRSSDPGRSRAASSTLGSGGSLQGRPPEDSGRARPRRAQVETCQSFESSSSLAVANTVWMSG